MVLGQIGLNGVHVQKHVVVEIGYVQDIVTILRHHVVERHVLVIIQKLNHVMKIYHVREFIFYILLKLYNRSNNLKSNTYCLAFLVCFS